MAGDASTSLGAAGKFKPALHATRRRGDLAEALFVRTVRVQDTQLP